MKLVKRGMSILNQAQMSFYKEQGYLVLPNFIEKSNANELKSRALKLIDEWDNKDQHIFTTNKQTRSTDQYFLDSAENISFFLEERADQATNKDKNVLINKIGHAIHDLDPVFESFSYQTRFRKILDDIGYRDPKIVQSMYIMKPPSIGGEVKIHQDNSYLITEPSSCIGVWLAVEDAKKDNACMWAVPGSHKLGTLTYFSRSGDKVSYTDHPDYSSENGVFLEVEAGTVILLHGDLVHWSDQNKSSKSRHAYTLHVVESDNVVWSDKNWIQRKQIPFKNWSLS